MLDNILTGNSGANQLSGQARNDALDGGNGLDVLLGGLGDDTYLIDVSGEIIIEQFGEGADLTLSSAPYALLANVEHLTLAGALNVNGLGNVLDNRLTGNGRSNQLTGQAGNDTLDGGAGLDVLIGGLGDDVYVVDVSGEVLVEKIGDRIDTAFTSTQYVLASNIEQLVLTGSSNINGF